MEWVEQITSEGCNVLGESQDLATNQLQGQLRDCLQCRIELGMMTRESHN